MAITHRYRECCINPGIPMLCLLLISSPPALARIYKWTDTDGRVHYGDKPETNDAVEVETTNLNPPADPGLKQRQDQQRRLLDVLDDDREKEAQSSADEKAAEQARQTNCEMVRNRLAAMQSSSFLYEKTPDPDNPRILSTDEYNEAIKTATADVQTWCEKSGKSSR